MRHTSSEESRSGKRLSTGELGPLVALPGGGYLDAMSLIIEVSEGPQDYLTAWAKQRKHHEEVASGAQDFLWLLEHPAVYTAGRRTDLADRPTDGSPVVDVDRGGRITWHGPGQLVGYPIVRLPDPIDVVAHVRRMEGLLIEVCQQLGLATDRVEGRSGVWVLADAQGPDRKVAAIGVRVSRGVSMHGFALNCDPDLAWYDRIVPCGIRDARVTSLSAELGHNISVAQARALVVAEAHRLLGP